MCQIPEEDATSVSDTRGLPGSQDQEEEKGRGFRILGFRAYGVHGF